jgi:hypothetical protein
MSKLTTEEALEGLKNPPYRVLTVEREFYDAAYLHRVLQDIVSRSLIAYAVGDDISEADRFAFHILMNTVRYHITGSGTDEAKY